MPQFDRERVTKLVSQLRTSVARLKVLSGLPEKDFLGNPDKIGSAKYHFIVAIEACIDLSNHIISQNGYRVPEDYADTFAVMREAVVFDEDFTSQLKQMAKFRNRLVHIYWEVDDAQVFEILKNRLDDFRIFLEGLFSFLGLAKT
jgi:uncharacterized protein YutE (UPF0331/DUF86 family)